MTGGCRRLRRFGRWRLVPWAGSDPNVDPGAVVVLGIFGLKPTYGSVVPEGHSVCLQFDHLGPFARSVSDLALAYDAMQGPDRRTPAHARPPNGVAAADARHRGLRIAIAGIFS